MGLDVAAWEKDVEWTEQIMRELLESIESVGNFAESDLFRHLTFKKSDPEFYRKMRDSIIQSIDDDSFSYMKGNIYWENLHKNATASGITEDLPKN